MKKNKVIISCGHHPSGMPVLEYGVYVEGLGKIELTKDVWDQMVAQINEQTHEHLIEAREIKNEYDKKFSILRKLIKDVKNAQDLLNADQGECFNLLSKIEFQLQYF